KFIGYNQYGVLINKDVQGVTLSCDAGLGYINSDGLLVASGTTNGVLTANYNGIQTKVNIVLVEEAEIAIRLDSVLIDGKFEYPIEVQSIIGLNTMNVLSSALSWTVLQPDICSVQNGILKGLSNGTATVIGNLGSFKDTIIVKVEIPGSGRIVHEDFSNAASWTVTPPLTSWNTTLNTDGLPNGWTHGVSVRYTYKTTRSPSIRMSKLMPLYGIPDTIKLVLNTGNVEITKLILGLRTNNQTANTALTFNSLQLNKDIEINIPVSQIATNVNDIHSYPVWFDYFTLYINSLTQTQDVIYNIYLKEIALRYKNISLGINPTKTSSKIHVFPNPFVSNELMLNFEKQINGPLSTNIFNLNGQLMCSQHFENISKDYKISVESLIVGTYLLQINYENHEETIKIVKH
ncbi:MAG TPA: T9SS type A sorting domain-containing protein, partial [Paludibacter sp.]|nr:T9SS type A sorting domain-containing protein [Paludibacter sp.]